MLNKRPKRDKPVVIVLMRSSGRVSIRKSRPDVFLPLPLAAQEKARRCKEIKHKRPGGASHVARPFDSV
jgi:hypothetical protein